jgi:1,2-phenylacetyl-CoA epoxidase catalytic subunit
LSGDGDIIRYLQRGGRLSAPDNAPPRYRAELLRIMASFVDSELAGAAGFADRINDGPGLKERIAAARIVLEKHDHAERVLRIMGEFGADTARYQSIHPWAARIGRDEDIGASRRVGDMRLNVFHYPLISWADAVAMNVLMGWATVIQLGDLAECSYQPLAEAFFHILPRERRHAELGEEGLMKLAASDASRAEVSRSLDYWWPRVAASFGGRDSARAEMLRRYGLRRRANDELLGEWRARINAVMGAAFQSWGGRC